MSFVENLVTMDRYKSSNAAPYTALLGKEFKSTLYPNETFKLFDVKIGVKTKKNRVLLDGCNGSKRKLSISPELFKQKFTKNEL